MESPTKLTVPPEVAYCKGRVCDQFHACGSAGACLYKSSSEQAKEIRQAKVQEFESVPAIDLDERFERVNNKQVEMFDLGILPAVPPVVRTFATGANRDVDNEKPDYDGFLSPSVLERFAEYMHKNRKLRDGSVRDSDNWQKGIPQPVYRKSLWRHFLAVWKGHRAGADIEEDLCAMLFNTQGLLHEVLKARPA